MNPHHTWYLLAHHGRPLSQSQPSYCTSIPPLFLRRLLPAGAVDTTTSRPSRKYAYARTVARYKTGSTARLSFVQTIQVLPGASTSVANAPHSIVNSAHGMGVGTMGEAIRQRNDAAMQGRAVRSSPILRSSLVSCCMHPAAEAWPGACPAPRARGTCRRDVASPGTPFQFVTINNVIGSFH